MTSNLSRAHFLFEQRRYDMAAQELGRQIAENPDDPFAHCLLALCFSQLKQNSDAIREAQTAIYLAPDLPNGYYVLGNVLDDVGRFKEAEAAAREAIRLDPEEANYFALAASIRTQQRQWADVVVLADQGLAIDPDHLACANLKAAAQVNLGQQEAAAVTIQSALEKDPENAATQANQGWAQLHQGDHKAALEHFREALRLNPGMEWAQQGILEALRARNPIYRMMLRYFLWMDRFSGKRQFGIIAGAWIGYQVVRGLLRTNPSLGPVLIPLIVVYVAFVYLSWTAKPLFNLLLRLDRYGRYALNRDQIVASNWLGTFLLLALACLGGALATQRASLWFLALAFAMLTIPLAATFNQARHKGRVWRAWATGILTLFSIVTASVCFFRGPNEADTLFMIFVFGCGAFVWVHNLTAARREYR